MLWDVYKGFRVYSYLVSLFVFIFFWFLWGIIVFVVILFISFMVCLFFLLFVINFVNYELGYIYFNINLRVDYSSVKRKKCWDLGIYLGEVVVFDYCYFGFVLGVVCV